MLRLCLMRVERHHSQDSVLVLEGKVGSMTQTVSAPWHVLAVGSIWIKEFASALSKQVPTLGWLGEVNNLALFKQYEYQDESADPPLVVRRFAMQRGYSFPPVSWLTNEAARTYARLEKQSSNVSASTLVCTSPHYASVAARWGGSVIYYLTDLVVAYPDSNRKRVNRFDRKLCEASNLVCPNSQMIADYLINEAGCSQSKIVIIPNATRSANLFDKPQMHAHPLPSDVSELPRPVAGVIGAMGGNVDWVLLQSVIERTPWLSWVFVGPTTTPVEMANHYEARRRLMEHGGRIRFVGSKPYGLLRDYARALDVSILPYNKRRATYAGSATRFYEHLATCRPMIATSNVEELLHKEPLLTLAPDAQRMVEELEKLRSVNFADGYEGLRWRTSQTETWEARASLMRQALSEKI